MKIALSVLVTGLLSTHFTTGLEVICPEEWTQWKGGCYRFYNQPELSWDEAEAHCSQCELSPEICPGKTAHLVTIGCKEENNFVFKLWKSLRPNECTLPQRVWIGINDKKKEGEYFLMDGTPAKHSKWIKGLPDKWSPEQDCGEMWRTSRSDSGYWNDYTCGEKHAFMCEFRCC